MRVTYCMQRDQKTNQLCATEISWARFITHGAICDDCEKKRQIVAEKVYSKPFELKPIATYPKP